MAFAASLSRDLPLTGEASRLRRRDPAALAEAVERYHHRLYRYLLRLVREPAAADDLYQQTWLNVVRKIVSYDAHMSLDTWLFAIAHNAAMDFLRRKRGESLEEYPASGPDALSQAMGAERARILESAVSELPAVYRESLTLRFEEGMKLEEIAEVTGVPLSTAKSRVQRGLEMLRGRWRKEDLL